MVATSPAMSLGADSLGYNGMFPDIYLDMHVYHPAPSQPPGGRLLDEELLEELELDDELDKDELLELLLLELDEDELLDDELLELLLLELDEELDEDELLELDDELDSSRQQQWSA